jgi:hypothetical protein
MQYYCDDLDLGPFLHEGPNVIALKVVSFPPQEALGRPREGYADMGPTSVIGTASGPCLLFSGEVSGGAGTSIDLTTGYAPWLVCNDEAVSWLHPSHTMVFCHEEVAAEKIPAGWNSGTEVVAGFTPAIRRWSYDSDTYGEISPLPLFKRPIPMLFETEGGPFRELAVPVEGKKAFSFSGPLGKPEKVTLPAMGSYSVDLDAGELTTGYVILETEGEGEVILTYAESYGGPFTGGKRKDRLDYENFRLGGFKDIYRSAGARGQYEFFWFRTFRVVRIEVTTASKPLTLWPLRYRETGYPLEAKTGVNPAREGPKSAWIPGLWDISLRTLRRCMHETYEDCPYYEQMQYTFDTRLQMLFTYCLSGDTRMGLKTIDDFHRSMLPEGIIQSRYPTNNPQVIPTFSFSWLSMLLDYYTQTADVSVLERYRPTAEHILLWFKRKKNSRGFVEGLGYWNFTDWAPEWNSIHGSVRAAYYGPSTVQNLMYVYGLQLLGRILDILGFGELKAYYLNEAKGIQDRVLECCWDEKRRLFKEGPDYTAEYTQHSQLWAVLTGTISGKEAQELMNRTLSEKGLITCTFPLQFYFFRALEKAGLYEKTESLWEDWKRFLPLNLSTLPETPYDDSRSDCHAWSSLLLYEYPAKILGVYAAEPGYKVIGVKPQGLFLGGASGRVCTPAGMVEVSWNCKGGEFSLQGELPAGAKGRLVLPDGSAEDLAGGPFSAKRRLL